MSMGPTHLGKKPKLSKQPLIGVQHSSEIQDFYNTLEKLCEINFGGSLDLDFT